MNNDIIKILKLKGPMLSGQLASELVKKGISNSTARQRISRRADSVKELYGLPFPKKAKFLFLENQFGTDKFYSALYKALKEGSPAYSAAIAGIQARGGVILKKYFSIISGSPIAQKGQIPAEVILERLIKAKVFHITDITSIGECISLDRYNNDISYYLACLKAESIIIDAIKLWLNKMNMASIGKTEVRGGPKIPQFSTAHFDIVSPNYLKPLCKYDKQKNKLNPGFTAVDIILGKILSEDEVSYFIRKCKLLSNIKNNRPFIPMLIADGFSKEALKVCRAAGMIVTTPATLFGSDVAISLKELIDTLHNAAAIAATSPDKIEKLLNSLGKIEGAAINLRGALFEMIVGNLAKITGGTIDIGKIATYTITNKEGGLESKSAEIDVRCINEKIVTIYECKGYQPKALISDGDIDIWLQKTAVIYKAYKQDDYFHNKNFYFNFWTTGEFSAEALKKLKKIQKKTKKYNIDWKNGQEVLSYSNKIDSPGIRKILKEHYFSHPLSK